MSPFCPAGCQLEARPAAPFSFRTALHPLACGAGLLAGPGCPLGRAAPWAGLLAGPGCPLGRAAPWAGLPPGPGCLACPWAAARPRVVRAASFTRRVDSLSGQAPPPPTSTAARPSGPSGALHTSGAWCDGRPGTSARSPARPYLSPPAPPPDPPNPPTPSTPVGPGVMGGPARRLEVRPGPTSAHRHRRQTLQTLRRPPHQRAWSRHGTES